MNVSKTTQQSVVVWLEVILLEGIYAHRLGVVGAVLIKWAYLMTFFSLYVCFAHIYKSFLCQPHQIKFPGSDVDPIHIQQLDLLKSLNTVLCHLATYYQSRRFKGQAWLVCTDHIKSQHKVRGRLVWEKVWVLA